MEPGQATILPYIKAPTAPTGVGNGAVEGGFILPVNYKLSDNPTLTTMPELDFLKERFGRRPPRQHRPAYPPWLEEAVAPRELRDRDGLVIGSSVASNASSV